MRVAIDISKCLALLAVTVMCSLIAWHVHTLPDLSATVTKLNLEIDEAHRLTLEAGLTAMEARKASAKESEYLDQWNSQITSTFQNVNVAVSSLSTVSSATVSTLQETQVTVHSLQAPIQSANQTLMAAQKAIEDLQPVIAHTDALVSNPALAATISNVAGTTGHLDATSADVQAVVHGYLHPTWAHKIFSWTLDIGHVFNPL